MVILIYYFVDLKKSEDLFLLYHLYHYTVQLAMISMIGQSDIYLLICRTLLRKLLQSLLGGMFQHIAFSILSQQILIVMHQFLSIERMVDDENLTQCTYSLLNLFCSYFLQVCKEWQNAPLCGMFVLSAILNARMMLH